MCEYYPCHFDGQDCTFCFCPFYPCEDNSKGRWILKEDTDDWVWDCSPCRWIHEEEVVGKIVKRLKDLKMSDVDDFERRRDEVMEIKRQINSGEAR
ncbi:MAG: Cysteine-rich small domain protein [Candidatus Methanolliviera sp. GoM_oil]|nr:MAG: Cysteine-rich small domain protein [Candidatus Methanolliviera sp. GoM_asphalt]VUT23923.1 MAG: Cysteine-rich small domain protein [Candidatus Methanolliviera sp. GoM_oil]